MFSHGESLDSELDKWDGGILNIVPLLGVSCLETWLGGPTLRSSGSPLPRVMLQGGAINRRVQDQGLPKFYHLSSLDGAPTMRVIFGGFVLWRRPTWVRGVVFLYSKLYLLLNMVRL
jgi:hypothetical protein